MFFSVFLRFVTVSAGAGGEKITRMLLKYCCVYVEQAELEEVNVNIS